MHYGSARPPYSSLQNIYLCKTPQHIFICVKHLKFEWKCNVTAIKDLILSALIQELFFTYLN